MHWLCVTMCQQQQVFPQRCQSSLKTAALELFEKRVEYCKNAHAMTYKNRQIKTFIVYSITIYQLCNATGVLGNLQQKGQGNQMNLYLRYELMFKCKRYTTHNSVMHNWVYMDININYDNSRYIFLLINSSFNVTVIFRYKNIQIYTSHISYNALDWKKKFGSSMVAT